MQTQILVENSGEPIKRRVRFVLSNFYLEVATNICWDGVEDARPAVQMTVRNASTHNPLRPLLLLDFEPILSEFGPILFDFGPILLE